MAEDRNSPGPSGADHDGSEVGGVDPGSAGADPIFHQAEPTAETGKSTVLLWQFFLFPLLIVVAALGIFLLFGAFAGDSETPQELAERLVSGGSNEQAQSAHQLALLIREEYDKQQGDPDRDPPFYAESSFRRAIVQALATAVSENTSAKRQELLAIMAGLIQAEEAIPSLLEPLFPSEGNKSYDDDVRFGAVLGLVYFDGRSAQSALARVASDLQDNEVRALAMTGLVKIAGAPGAEDPMVLAALRKGLTADHPGVRVQAACGLGVRGVRDPSGLQILDQALTREGLSNMKIGERFQPGALRNACRAAAALADPSLKEKVERLASSELEGDDQVRLVAQDQLNRWGQPRKE